MSSGFVESKRISSGDAFPIWITFENRSDGEIRNLRFVDFRKGGLELVREDRCWRPIQPADPRGPKFPSCVLDTARPTQPSDLPARLAPGQAITLTANLKRSGRSGEFMVTGVYTWVGTEGDEHRAIIPIGPIEVTKNWENWRARVSEDLPVILKDIVFPALKDLGWPLAAFFLGLYLRLGEERRASIQQAWSQMLPEVHKSTAKYYLPIQSSAQGLIASLGNRASRDPDEPFYFLALLLRRMRATVQENGGVYFKDRLGEDITMDAWEIIFREFVGIFPAGTGVYQKEILRDSIAEDETLREYKKKIKTTYFPFSRRADLVNIKVQFENWVGAAEFRELVLPLLKVFVTTIAYEINRPYAAWYTQPPALEVDKLEQREQELKEWLTNARARATNVAQREKVQRVGEFYDRLKEYRQKNTKHLFGTKWVFRLWYRLSSLVVRS